MTQPRTMKEKAKDCTPCKVEGCENDMALYGTLGAEEAGMAPVAVALCWKHYRDLSMEGKRAEKERDAYVRPEPLAPTIHHLGRQWWPEC